MRYKQTTQTHKEAVIRSQKEFSSARDKREEKKKVKCIVGYVAHERAFAAMDILTNANWNTQLEET